MLVVIFANTHSSGESGGFAYAVDEPFRRFELWIAQAQRLQIRHNLRAIAGSSRSSDTSPICGV